MYRDGLARNIICGVATLPFKFMISKIFWCMEHVYVVVWFVHRATANIPIPHIHVPIMKFIQFFMINCFMEIDKQGYKFVHKLRDPEHLALVSCQGACHILIPYNVTDYPFHLWGQEEGKTACLHSFLCVCSAPYLLWPEMNH